MQVYERQGGRWVRVEREPYPCGELTECPLRDRAKFYAHTTLTYCESLDEMLVKLDRFRVRCEKQYGCSKCPLREQNVRGVLDVANGESGVSYL